MNQESTLLAASIAGIMTMAFAHGARATDVAVCTDRGRVVLELADVQAPKHVANFLRYVDMAYYSGTVFHRAVPGFVVQGGGVDRELRGRPTLPPVENESSNGLSNVRGSVAAARTQDPNSAGSQFFVNLEDNTQLDAGAEPGYTVFGRVKEGIQVLDEISRLPTGAKAPFPSDVPDPLVAITSVTRLDAEALAGAPEADRDGAVKERIAAAVAAQDHAAALQAVGLYRAACGPNDSQIAVHEAKAALALNERRRAVFVLEEYFASTQESDPMYAEALALYRTAVPESRQSAAQLVDDCDPPATPAIPDGTVASMEQMVAAQSQVRDFVAAGEAYLACLAKVIDDENRGAEDRNIAISEHNRMVSAMEQSAADFNAQIKVFKAREQ
jgi:peptidyl-prolyl cis-trans isomerase A (cyclophilin A)